MSLLTPREIEFLARRQATRSKATMNYLDRVIAIEALIRYFPCQVCDAAEGEDCISACCIPAFDRRPS